MAIAIKVLGHGKVGTTASGNQLLTASGYTSNAVPAGKAVIIKNIRLVNTHSVARTVTVKYNPAGGGTLRAVSPVSLAIPPSGFLILDDELILVATDKLQADFGETTGGDVVEFVVGGIERDA